MPESDAEYFPRRAKEERQRATQSDDPCAKQAHHQMADEYDRLSQSTNKPQLRSVPE